MDPLHEPVMVAEVLEHLAPARGGVFVDCTVGLGGHARAVLEAGASKVIGLDRDPAALAHAAQELGTFEPGGQIELVHEDYRQLDQVLEARNLHGVSGILADLGVSSMQLDAPGRGFSFRRDEFLDMRMDPTTGRPAAEVIRDMDERTLADVIHEFGEERYARRIARAIAEAKGTIETTGQLADVVRRAIPRRGYSRIDPATRTFQAIRIRVNRELEDLDRFLRSALVRLRAGARLAVITFHSLEDRIVKHTLRTLEKAGDIGVKVITRKPETPDED